MLQYGYSIDSTFRNMIMPLNSKAYISVILSGIILICFICLAMRWQILSAQQAVPRLGLKKGPVYTTQAHSRQSSRPDATNPAESPPPTGQNAGKPETGSADGQSGSSSTAQSPLLDINSASTTDLEALPGIGPVLAKRIMDYRELHGVFDTVDSLTQVEGIGQATLDSIRPLIKAGTRP